MSLRRRTCFIVLIAIGVVMVVADRLTKAWAADNLEMGSVGYDLGPISFTLVHNEGAAFGMAQGSTQVFVAIALAIIVTVVLWFALCKDHSAPEAVGLSLVAAGGIGNLIDRLTTVYVVDFIQFDFIDFPVFNVADICVTCGVALFIVTMVVAMFAPGSDEEEERAEEERR